MRLTLRADGAADLALVWRRYSQPELWTTWAPQIRRVECSSERLEVGSTGTVFGVVPNLGAKFEVVEFLEDEHAGPGTSAPAPYACTSTIAASPVSAAGPARP